MATTDVVADFGDAFRQLPFIKLQDVSDGLDDELTSQRLAFERLFKSDPPPPWMQ